MTNSNDSTTRHQSVRFCRWQFNFADDSLQEVAEDGRLIATDLDNICKKTLAYLIRNSERVVNSEELLNNVWGVKGVTYERISRAMSVIRTTLGDTPTTPKYIKTVSKLGYQFIGDISVVDQDGDAAGEPSELKNRLKLFSVSIFILLMIYLVVMAGYRFISTSTSSLTATDLSENLIYPHNFSLNPNSDSIVFVRGHLIGAPVAGADLVVKDLNTHDTIPLVKNNPEEYLFVPAWHPTKPNVIAYKRFKPGKLCEIHVVTLNPLNKSIENRADPITCSSKLLFIGFMDWSADGEHILYTDYAPASSNMAIFRVNTRTRNIDQLTSAPSSSVGDYYARPSRKGSELIYLRDVSRTVSQLWTMDLDSLEQKLQYTFPGKVYPKSIDFAKDGENYIYQDQNGVFTEINRNTMNLKAISSPTPMVDSFKMSNDGRLYAASMVPEQALVVSINNPFVKDIGTPTPVAFSNFYSVNPDSTKPNVFFIETIKGSELWLDNKDGSKKLLKRFETNHFNVKAFFSNDGDRMVVVIGDQIWLSNLQDKLSLLSQDGQILIRPSWGSDPSVVYAIDTENDWDLLAIDTNTLKQTKYLSGVSFFKQSPDGKFEIVVKFNSNDILLKDNSDNSVKNLEMPDYLNSKDLKVFFNGNYAYVKCAKCTYADYTKAQVILRVDLTTKDVELRTFEVSGNSREFAVSEDGSTFFLDSQTNRQLYKMTVLQ